MLTRKHKLLFKMTNKEEPLLKAVSTVRLLTSVLVCFPQDPRLFNPLLNFDQLFKDQGRYRKQWRELVPPRYKEDMERANISEMLIKYKCGLI